MQTMKGYRVRLYPTPNQEDILMEYCNASRYAYNWALYEFNNIYENSGSWITSNELCKIFTKKRSISDGDVWEWLRTFKASPLRIIVRSVPKLFRTTLKTKDKTNKVNFPKPIRKKDKHFFFFVRKEGVRIYDDKICFEGFNGRNKNWIKLGYHNIPHDKMYNYCDPHIEYEEDGTWWFSCLIKHEEPLEINESWVLGEPIGIDLGVKTFVTTSNGEKFNYPKNKINRIRNNLKRKQRRLTRYQKSMLDKSKRTKTKYENIPKSKNMQKLEKRIHKIQKRINNIKRNTRFEIVNNLIKRNPRAIVMEGINVTGMRRKGISKKFSDLIIGQCFYEMKKLVQYKCEWNDIEFIEADRWFPSSKMCSKCGNIKKDLTLKDRVYKCPVCGMVMDRDINAAINLKHLSYINIFE